MCVCGLDLTQPYPQLPPFHFEKAIMLSACVALAVCVSVSSSMATQGGHTEPESLLRSVTWQLCLAERESQAAGTCAQEQHGDSWQQHALPLPTTRRRTGPNRAYSTIGRHLMSSNQTAAQWNAGGTGRKLNIFDTYRIILEITISENMHVMIFVPLTLKTAKIKANWCGMSLG